MQLIKPTNHQQLLFCCDLYIEYDDGEFLAVDRESCYKSIQEHYRRNGYIRLIVNNGEIVGFIMAVVSRMKYSNLRHLVQEFFCTNLKGFAAAKAVKLAHRDLVREAKQLMIPVVISAGSHMDPENTFVRILEREGWKRKGHIAVIRLQAEPTASAQEAHLYSGSLGF